MEELNYKAFSEMCELSMFKRRSISEKMMKQRKLGIKFGTYKIIYSPLSYRPVGYILWSEISEESKAQLIRFKIGPVYFHEWFEGPIINIVDVVILPGWASLLYLELKGLTKNINELMYMKKQKVNIWQKKRGGDFQAIYLILYRLRLSRLKSA